MDWILTWILIILFVVAAFWKLIGVFVAILLELLKGFGPKK